MDKGLKLLARDADALTLIAAHLQDAVLRVGDMAHDSAMRRFVALANRYRYEQKTPSRIRCALVIENVQSVRHKAIRRDAADAVLSLLDLRFTPNDAPSGELALIFSGGGEVALEVEACSVMMEDIGTAWQTQNRPKHKL